MPQPVFSHLSRDVIDGDEPAGRTWWGWPLILAGGGVTVGLVGVMALLAAEDDAAAAVVDAHGSMVVEHHLSDAAEADRPHSTLREDKNARFSGPIRVDLPDRQLVGTAELTFSFAAQIEGDHLWVVYNWGEVHATFGSTTCDGPLAWIFYREPRETGGSMSLRCDDGSLLAATAIMEGDEDSSPGQPYRVFFTLEDGSYVAG